MAFPSFRDFLETLEQSGDLRRLSQTVATELEITEIANREMKKPGGGQALLFEQPTINGQASPFPLAINTLVSHPRMPLTLALGSLDHAPPQLASPINAPPPPHLPPPLQLL